MADDDDSRKASNKRFSDEAIESAKQELFGGVGYKRPPQYTQFKKCQSGNPKGRPRGMARDLSMSDQPTLESALRASRKPVNVREGDKVSEVPIRDAIIQSIYAAALKGNARSQGLSLDLIRTAEQAHARDIEARNEIWSDVKAKRQRRLGEAMEHGKPTRDILPHPDDIIIDHVNWPRIIGPICKEEQIKCEETIAFCEVLLMQNELDERTPVRLNGEPLDEPGPALLIFDLLQSSLPPRLRLAMGEITYRMSRYQAKSKRASLKELHQAWHKFGKPCPRGTVFPNLGDMRKWLESLFELAAEAIAGRVDLEAMARGEFDERAIKIMAEYGFKAA